MCSFINKSQDFRKSELRNRPLRLSTKGGLGRLPSYEGGCQSSTDHGDRFGHVNGPRHKDVTSLVVEEWT